MRQSVIAGQKLRAVALKIVVAADDVVIPSASFPARQTPLASAAGQSKIAYEVRTA